MTEGDKYHGYRPAQLRTLIQSGNWHHSKLNEALAWLDAQEERERSLIEASSAEQMRLTRQANQIARQARDAAIAALIVAIIGAIAAIIALF